jgi:uncharacterized protein YbaP (TraB family)
MLLGAQFKELGLQNGEGVEFVLRDAFTAQGKQIGELETNVEQLGFFDRLPESAQLALLEGAIEGNGDARQEFGRMLDAWSRGDVKGIAATFDEQLSTSPDLQQGLIRRRNENWSRWIEQRLKQPGQVMVAVGAGHLAGRDSVIDLLTRAGYRVRRIQ